MTELTWFRERLKRHENGSHPGMTLNLTTRQAKRLESHLDALEGKLADLDFMRGIAIDIFILISSGSGVPPGMLEAFGDALEFKHPEQRGGET